MISRVSKASYFPKNSDKMKIGNLEVRSSVWFPGS